MKKLSSSGTSLIVQPHVWPKRVIHSDPWESHGFEFYGQAVGHAASGAVYALSSWDLKDGNRYYYPYGIFPDDVSCGTFQAGWTTYTNADGITAAFGEWFNFVERPLGFDKILAADIRSWLDAR